MKINFKKNSYELLFSNNLTPFWALLFADNLFFNHFKKICGKKYRILSIIKNGWQEKYGLTLDLEELKIHFDKKIKDISWSKNLLKIYDSQSLDFEKELERIDKIDFQKGDKNKIFNNLKIIRKKSAILDAMSNALFLFSVLNGPEFEIILNSYNIKDRKDFNKNLIFFTQPIKESRFAKIKIKKFVKRIKLNRFDSNFSLILRTGAYIKDDVSDLLSKRQEVINKMFIVLSEELNIKLNDFSFLQLDEIFNLKPSDIKRLVKSRKKLTIIYYEHEKMQIIEGEIAKLFLKKGGFSQIKELKNKNLTGQIANPGKVIGRAVVVSNSKEANLKSKEGDILIAPYTAVEYLPAMKKALAIITETGGITSHAAIVSRELGIPCVIGVKNVTSIIRTGDKISLDADNGEIKIIN